VALDQEVAGSGLSPCHEGLQVGRPTLQTSILDADLFSVFLSKRQKHGTTAAWVHGVHSGNVSHLWFTAVILSHQSLEACFSSLSDNRD